MGTHLRVLSKAIQSIPTLLALWMKVASALEGLTPGVCGWWLILPIQNDAKKSEND